MEEAWGRVASEAHCSGIPVLGSRRGGLPGSHWRGWRDSRLRSAVEDWAKALQRLWKDGDYYASMSKAAHDFSRRPLLQPERQFELFMGVLEKSRWQDEPGAIAGARGV